METIHLETHHAFYGLQARLRHDGGGLERYRSASCLRSETEVSVRLAFNSHT